MSGANGKTPVAVPQAGKRAGEARLERPSAEPAIWTKRMLATLEQGVTGGKWYSLIDKLYPVATLEAAFAAVKANQGAAGVDHVSIEDCAAKLETNLARLSESLRTGVYRPQAIRRHDIPKHVLGPAEGRTRGPGSQEKRPLGIPTVQDRVVQTALRMLLEPIPRVGPTARPWACFEREFAAQSYGFRPNLGCKDALRRVDELLRAGYVHVVDADLKSHPRDRPKGMLRHDPEGSPAGAGRWQGAGSPRACAGRGVPRPEGPGRRP